MVFHERRARRYFSGMSFSSSPASLVKGKLAEEEPDLAAEVSTAVDGLPAAPLNLRGRLVETVDRAGGIGPPVAVWEAHRAGMAHRAISIVAWNATRTRMLITRRAGDKATWPDFWSNAVCSHPLPRETSAAAARRRLFEELGIRGAVAPAFRMFYGPVRCPVSGVFEHELDQVFYAQLPEDAPLEPNPAEISAWRWADPAELAARRQSGELTPWFALILERVRWGR
jgi:isopentenyl-diphosphate delta-isomerase